MDLKEISDLIAIRQYVVNATANFSIDRDTVNELGNILLMLDRKIISALKTPEFKSYINYNDVGKVKEEVVRLNNIKSGLKK